MPEINTSITNDTNSNSLGGLINDPNNIYNQALGSLPDVPAETTDATLPTDVSTNEVISTDIVVPTLPTDATATDYEVWAATWMRSVNTNATSVVPMVWVDNMGGWVGSTTTDNSSWTNEFVTDQNYVNFKNNLLQIPEGRRVIQTTFWSAVPANYTWSPLTYIDYYAALDGTTFEGRNLIWSPWQDNVINDAKVSLDQFLSRCSSDGLTFNYITDNTFYGDGGAPVIWNLSIPPVMDVYKIYVATTGNDSATGISISEPVQTFKKAADLAKVYFANGGTKNVEIQIRGGEYKILGTDSNPVFYLNSTYSAPDGKTITFKPYNNEQVVISGAESIPHTEFSIVTSSDPKWSRISTEARGNVYVADISAYDIGPGIPSMWNGGRLGGDVGGVGDLPAVPDLIFNGKTMTVARWPNKTSQNSSGYTFAECAAISTVVDTGTSGVWCVGAENLSYDYDLASTGEADDADCLCGSGAPYNANCFRDGSFTYSSDYDSVISTWTSDAINDGIWLHGTWKWDWSDEAYKVISINTSTRTIVVRSRNSQYGIMNINICDQSTGEFLGWDKQWQANSSPRRWFALNILEELDTPGEYYIDRTNKKLYFWPTEAINSNSDIRFTHRAIAGMGAKNDNTFEVGYQTNGQPSRTCPNCFPYKGFEDINVGWSQTGAAGQSRHIYNTRNALKSLFKFYQVKNIIIEGLTFRDSAGGGIELNLCTDMVVKNCTVFNIKKDGIAALGGKNITIDSCTLYDIGRHAIINTGGNRQTLEHANKVVTKCSIKRWNRNKLIYSSAIIMSGCGNTASYNLIAEGSQGILCGGNYHKINHNHFHRVQQDSEDAGVIYCGRNLSWFGIVIENNLFTECKTSLPGGYYVTPNGTCEFGLGHGVNTIYFDDFQTESTVKNNIFYDCGSGHACCFYANGGVKHKIENNIFVDSRRPYGAASGSEQAWNNHVTGTRLGIFNHKNYPWYESGGPLGSSGEITPVTGYSPYNHLWITGEVGTTWWENDSWAGIMPVVDISSPIYLQEAPHLSEMFRINSTAKTAICIPDPNVYTNTASRNILVNNTASSLLALGKNGVSGSNNYFQGNNTFISFEEATINDLFTSTEKSNLNFKLTPEKLTAIRAVVPGFENIDFDGIPKLNYVPESQASQSSTQCAQGNRHYTCERDFSDPDALEAIITDARFTSTVNTINGKTLSQDFMSRYNSIITKTNTTDRSLYTIYSNDWYVSPGSTPYQILEPNFGYIVEVGQPNRMQLFPWANSSTNAATRAWSAAMWDWGLFYRVDFFKQPLIDNGYSNVKYAIDYAYPMTAEEAKYHQDQYGGWQEGVRDNITDALITPALYGEITSTMFNTYAYIANPQNDDQKYMMALVYPDQPLPDGYFRYTNASWLAFMLDLKRLRGIIRSDSGAWERLTPWINSRDYVGDRFGYGRDRGNDGEQYWKEIIFHACLHGTGHFNYFNASSGTQNEQVNTLEMHNALDQWRQASGNSRAQPVTTNRIASNSSVVISGARLLNSNMYLWRITAKPSASTTLRTFGTSTTRTDIPQTINLGEGTRGAWVTTSSSVPPIYILDEGNQQEDTELVYISLMRSDLEQSIHKSRAMFGGSTHDFGSGIGFDQNNKSLSALTYFTNSNIEISGHQVGNLNWYYTHSYRLDSNGNAIPVKIRTSPTNEVSLCNIPCYSGAGCYQAPPVTWDEFIKEMSQDGEWGPALRPNNPFPNRKLDGTYFPYLTINDEIFTFNGYNASLFGGKQDYTFDYIASSGGTESFWQKSSAQGGRSDLAYNYDSQGTIQLKPGHEHVIPQSDLTVKLRTVSDGVTPKMEPGNMWKYKGFVFAPIRNDDGCADHLWIDRYVRLLNMYKEYEEYKYFVMNLPNVPSCIVQSNTWNNLVHEDFDSNGKYKPNWVFVNYEDELVDQIRCINPTGRTGPNNYGTINGQPLTNEIWLRAVSYIKLTRKMNYHIRQVLGEQAKVNHYDMMPFPYYQEWSLKHPTSWYTNKSGILWAPDIIEVPTDCPFCGELNIGYPGDAVYNQLPAGEKIAFTTKAQNALQEKVFKFAKVIAKMCLFENAPDEPDVLDLRAELTELFPQIDPNNFIITGLNHYENSVHGALVNNVHKYYSSTQNGFNSAETVNITNNAEANKSRQMSIHHKEQARVGLFDNQRSGKLYSFFVQGVCGSDVAPMQYEYYNSNMESNAGLVKSWSNGGFNSTEVNQFPTTTTDPNHKPGVRKYDSKFSVKNISRRSVLRHMPWINLSNDFLNRTQLASTIKYKDEIIWADNNIASVVMTNLNKTTSAPQGFYDQKRPCAQGESTTNGCRDIVAEPYVKPIIMDDNVRVRNNAFDTVNCSSDPTNSGFSPNCVSYCYVDPVVPAGGSSTYGTTALLNARRHVYSLAVEYASYDDMVAIPLEDIGNDVYWTGYYGQFANFDPYITTPPATQQEARSLDSTGWPYIRLSETAKRAQALTLILAARKDYSLFKHIKNPDATNLRDWPQPAANFSIDRRPGITIANTVSGAYSNLLNFVGDNTTNVASWKKCLDGSGNPIPNTGFQKLIDNYLTWNYEQGVRRFMMWTPGGTLLIQNGGGYPDLPIDSFYPVYTSAITSSMQNKIYEQYRLNADGTTTVINRYVNPAEACWKNITVPFAPVAGDSGTLLIPATVEEAESYPLCSDSDWDGESPCFDPDGRKNEVLTCLSQWISTHSDADVGIYMGYTIPLLGGEPEHGINTIIGSAGSGNLLQNENRAGRRGWAVPNPANNSAHADFLMEELQPWVNAGINFFGFDVGVGMFNYENGGTLTYGATAASRTPVGDYKEWLISQFGIKTVIAEALAMDFRAPILDEYNRVVPNTNHPRKTILKIDRTKEVCKGTVVPAESENGDPWNQVYTDTCWHNKGRERYRKLAPEGKDYRTESGSNNDLVYSSGAYQYCPYIITLNGYLNSGEWNIGMHNDINNIGNFAGVDPNNMLCWYRKNTEVGVMVENMELHSETLRKKYREYFPNSKDSSGNFVYNNLWQLVPAWHDQGLATKTASPAGIPEWDGRNILRDSDFYNKVRNEVYIKIKNYVERGYVYWSTIGKESFQLNRDIHVDLLNYVAGFEINDNIYPEDALTAPLTKDLEQQNFSTKPTVSYDVKQNSIKEILLDTYTSTDEA